ncbi:vegetative cell wall protein gp1-like [Camellia sinensis]|uniref:vegetative cell wall protein gp1-like n=1 Tax=Camellia sinensis TaxID=4442 RepID=UPI001036DCF5|nr:vegetative cell wall protein gp1-like [Camellia sinensis]
MSPHSKKSSVGADAVDEEEGGFVGFVGFGVPEMDEGAVAEIGGAGLETGVAEGVPVQPILQGRQANTLDHDGYRIAERDSERGGVKICQSSLMGPPPQTLAQPDSWRQRYPPPSEIRGTFYIAPLLRCTDQDRPPSQTPPSPSPRPALFAGPPFSPPPSPSPFLPLSSGSPAQPPPSPTLFPTPSEASSSPPPLWRAPPPTPSTDLQSWNLLHPSA